MARQSNEFLMAWSSLSVRSDEAGWQAIPIDPAWPVELLAGRRSSDNAEAVLLGFPIKDLSPIEKLPEGRGFTVERFQPKEGASDKLWLALTRKVDGGKDLFAIMVSDVIGALDSGVAAGVNERKLLRTFIGRVGAWQEFMRKGLQGLSAEEEIGLVGELFVLKSIVHIGMPMVLALESWLGPLDAHQDFELGTGAIEVKSSLSKVGFVAKIGSLEQLDDSVRQPLYVAGVRLRQVDSGKTLLEVIDEIKSLVRGDMEAERLLSERVIAAGVIAEQSTQYSRRFELGDIRIFEVNQDFPRLIQGSVPVGITKARYEVDLDKIVGRTLRIDEALNELGIINI